MSETQQPETSPPASQVAFQRTTDALAHHVMGLMVTMGVPHAMAALAASQIIRAVIMDLARANPQMAKALLEELATGLVELMQEIGSDIDILGEGQTKQ